MKRLLIIVALLMCRAYGAITFVRCAQNSATSGSSIVITISPANGDTLIVGGNVANSTNHVASVSDNGTTSYSSPTLASANNPETGAVSALSVSGSPTSITVTFATSFTTTTTAIACEWSGVAAIGVKSASSAASSTTNPNLAITTQDNNNVVVCYHGIANNSRTWSSNQGTLRSNATAGGAIADATSA